MNEQEFRRAVRQIRWTDVKRKEIEARLSEPLAGSEADWPEVAEQHMVEVTHDSAKRTEVIAMKQKKTGKLLLLGAAAAILATGGAIAAVAGYGAKKMKDSEIRHENGTILRLTDEVNIPYYFNENTIASDNLADYTDPKTYITPVDGGCFYYQEHAEQGKERYVLMYKDYESGQSVPVCAKPDCKHDGSEYCTASSDVYAPSHLEYHDGYLYAMTTKFLHPEKRQMTAFDLAYYESVTIDHSMHDEFMAPEECRQVLLRYSPDGTQIEELHDFGAGRGVSKCLYHRGYIWCLVQLQSSGESSANAITGDTEQFFNGGWQLWGYEVASGKTVILCDGMTLPDKNHVNQVPMHLTASGDYLYFVRHTTDWSGSTGAIIRISLLTGKEESFVPAQDWIEFTPKKVVGRGAMRRVNGVGINDFYVMDIETGEKSEPKAIFKDATGEVGAAILPCAFMGSEYILVDEMFMRASAGDAASDSSGTAEGGKIYILDNELNKIGVTSDSISRLDDVHETGAGTAKIKGSMILGEYEGMIYFQEFKLIYDMSTGLEAADNLKQSVCTIKCFPAADLLSDGEPHYETVCSYEY